MTMTDSTPVASRLGYGISDADQHVYESAETLIEYLDPEYRHNFAGGFEDRVVHGLGFSARGRSTYPQT